MMSKGLRIGSMLLLAGALGMGVLFVTAIQGQVIHPDQMVGGLSLQGDSVQEGSTMPNEPGAGDVEKGIDRRMVVPDSDSSESMDTTMMRTPDAADAHKARESDSRSARSY